VKIFTLRHSWPVILEAKRRESILLAMALVFAVFTACDSGSSSTDPDPIAEVSSSSGDDEVFSSSSVTDKGTSSGGSSRSSSSVKPDSNGSQKSSSDNISSSSDNVSSSSREACAVEGLYHEVWSAEDQAWIGYYCQNGFYVLESEYVFPSSSSYYDMSKQYNENIKYGEFTDPRDGKVYRTITYEDKPVKATYVIMASNLNYGEMVPVDSATNADGVVEKFCYNDDPWYCDNGFGGLYSWSEAMGFHRACDTLFLGASADCPDVFDSLSTRIQHQGICPDGWHVLNEFEWRGLPSINFGTSQMLSKLFDGTDRVGLSVLLGGAYYVGNYEGMGEYVPFWTPQEVPDSSALASSVFLTTFLNANKVDFSHRSYKQIKAAVRCVKDYIVE
jgi:uncharacterized protein (TIGR02145 family)